MLDFWLRKFGKSHQRRPQNSRCRDTSLEQRPMFGTLKYCYIFTLIVVCSASCNLQYLWNICFNCHGNSCGGILSFFQNNDKKRRIFFACKWSHCWFCSLITTWCFSLFSNTFCILWKANYTINTEIDPGTFTAYKNYYNVKLFLCSETECSWLLEQLIPRRRSDKQPCKHDGVDVCVSTCVFMSLQERWEEWSLFSTLPFIHWDPEQSLDLAPDGGFINCNKWRQNASSCPQRLGMDLLSGSYGGTFDKFVTGHAAPSSPSCRLYLQCHLSSAAFISIQANLILTNI